MSFIKCYGKITAIGTEGKPIKFIGDKEGGEAIELVKSKDSHFEYCEFHNMTDIRIKEAREDYSSYKWDGRGDVPYESGFALNCYKCENLVVKNCKAYCSNKWAIDPIYEHECYNTTIENLKIYGKDNYEDDDEEYKFCRIINGLHPGKTYGP